MPDPLHGSRPVIRHRSPDDGANWATFRVGIDFIMLYLGSMSLMESSYPMADNLIPPTPAPLTPIGVMHEAGQAANTAARRSLFARYRQGRTTTTLLAQDRDLRRFATFLATAGVQVSFHDDDGNIQPASFGGLTFGLVAAFVEWQAQQGFAIASLNQALSTIKVYARLAMQAGVIAESDYRLIKTVMGYSQREGRNLDRRREQQRIDRPNAKKAEPTKIELHQADALKDATNYPDTPQGLRDRLLICLLLDHGLRVSEVADVMVDGFEREMGKLRFYRRKTDRWQTHRLTDATRSALRDYLEKTGLIAGPLLRGSRKDGSLLTQETAISTRALNERVRQLGAQHGIERLSPHDCRHYWATSATEAGTDIAALQDAGGWASPVMPMRYVEASAVANDRVKLKRGDDV